MQIRFLIKLLGIGFIVLALESCSSSSPRFASKERSSKSTEPEKKHGPRFSSKEAEEEVRETDKKVDAKDVERITHGERDFRKERNPAMRCGWSS